jgi:phosphate starvation-inducible protein PhoH and related proteins
LYDAMGALVPHEIIQRLKESETLEVAPLAYMRGRSIENAVIILDEAQNTTREQMKMFLTRLGEETTAVVCGDDTQVDLPVGAVSGLTDAARVLRGVDGVETVRFTTGDIVRSPLAMKIVEAYRRSDSHRETGHRKTDHRKTGHS